MSIRRPRRIHTSKTASRKKEVVNEVNAAIDAVDNHADATAYVELFMSSVNSCDREQERLLKQLRDYFIG